MPQVGNKHFPYTPQGRQDAAKARTQMQAGMKTTRAAALKQRLMPQK